MPRHMGTCFRFYKQMRVEKNPKHLPIKFIVTSYNSVVIVVVIVIVIMHTSNVYSYV